jgi:ubiquinone/menaquinone biosynthesis C-methylase UbiE
MHDILESKRPEFTRETAMEFTNAYEDVQFARAYAELEFPGTYYLAYRDLPDIIQKHVHGTRAIDFGCGAGRSTRFLRRLGFEACGIDISTEMIKLATSLDPSGDYRRIDEGGLDDFEANSFDLIFSAFTFDNIPSLEKKVHLFATMQRMLANKGCIVNMVSSPAIYLHEWASFSTRDFPQNRRAKCGDIVKIINTSVTDSRPVDDILWPDEDYRRVYTKSGLSVVEMFEPLAREDEPYDWINETKIAPWVIYVLKRSENA